MPDARITCPGCRRPLHVPADAVGKPARCPHCAADFLLPASPDGSAGEPRPLPPRRGVPRPLAVPALLLMTLGLAGTLVNGYLSARFYLEPGFGRQYARGWVEQTRSITAMSGAMHGKDEPGLGPHAAVGGGAGAVAAEELENEIAADAALPRMEWLLPVSAAVSALTFLGGVAAFRGRWYPLALLGCAAAAVNVNHLCCVPGAAVGAWAFLVLARDDVRAYFRRTA